MKNHPFIFFFLLISIVSPQNKIQGLETRSVLSPESVFKSESEPLHSYTQTDEAEQWNILYEIRQNTSYFHDYFRRLTQTHTKAYPGLIQFRSIDTLPSVTPSLSRIRHKGILRDENGICWILKKQEYDPDRGMKNISRREYFAYLLSQNIANLAEIRLLQKKEMQNLSLPESDNPEDYYLTRVVTGTNMPQALLPEQTPEDAFNANFVFNIFSRKWDAHFGNLGFSRGVPVAIDHDMTFQFRDFPNTSENSDTFLTLFLSHYLVSTFKALTSPEDTATLKILNEYPLSLYKIKSLIHTLGLNKGIIEAEMLKTSKIKTTLEKIKKMTEKEIRLKASIAGFKGSELELLVQYTLQNQQRLEMDAAYVWTFLTNDPFTPADFSTSEITLNPSDQKSPPMDLRPVEQKLLAAPYVQMEMQTHDLVQKNLATDTPVDKQLSLVFNAHTDISRYLLSHNISNAFFISNYHNITCEDLKRLEDETFIREKLYKKELFKSFYNLKYLSGYCYDPMGALDSKEKIIAALAFEFDALGIQNIHVTSNSFNNPVLEFSWKHEQDSEKKYRITLIQENSEKMDTLPELKDISKNKADTVLLMGFETLSFDWKSLVKKRNKIFRLLPKFLKDGGLMDVDSQIKAHTYFEGIHYIDEPFPFPENITYQLQNPVTDKTETSIRELKNLFFKYIQRKNIPPEEITFGWKRNLFIKTSRQEKPSASAKILKIAA